jgi:serine phosphatase RsbU (regulator of sigma subunit)
MKRLGKAIIHFVIGSLVLWTAPFAQGQSKCTSLLQVARELHFSNPDSAFRLSITAEQCALRQSDSSTYAAAQLSKSRYFLLKSDLDAAAQVIQLAQGYYTRSNDHGGLAYAYRLKSILMSRLKNTSEELMWQERSADEYRISNDKDGLSATLVNLSGSYMEMQRYEAADSALSEVRRLIHNVESSSWYYYFQNRGKLEMNRGYYNRAIPYLDSAARYAEVHNMTDSRSTIYMILGECYLAMKMFAHADSALSVSERIARTNKLDHELLEALLVKVKLYEAKQDYTNAFSTLNEVRSLEKSLLDIDRVNRIADLEKRVAIAQKERELEQQRQEANMAQARNRQLLIVVAVVLVAVLLLGFLWMRARKLKMAVDQQNVILEEKNGIIETKNKDITDSIQYARRIQESLLPTSAMIREQFPDSFVFFKPRDIVSGDFYWMHVVGNEVVLAVGDCTGHGVPGALMSVAGANLLNEAVVDQGITDPGIILDRMRMNLVRMLSRNRTEQVVLDGMDIAVICINVTNRTLRYAGAYNPLWIVNGSELIEIPANKLVVGVSPVETSATYTTHELTLPKGASVYLFTDGYADQFGGPNGKKLKYSRMKQMFLLQQDVAMPEMGAYLEREFLSWQGELEQVDDVCVVGLRL